jgi:TonB family protein
MYDVYRATASTNPTGPQSGADRVIRGGNWEEKDFYARVEGTPDYNEKTVGSRLAINLTPTEIQQQKAAEMKRIMEAKHAETKQATTLTKQSNSTPIDQEIANAQKALINNPNDAKALSELGRIYFNRGVEMLTKAERHDDVRKNVEAVYKKAIPYFELSYDLNDDDSNAVYALRAIYYFLGDEANFVKWDKLYSAQSTPQINQETGNTEIFLHAETPPSFPGGNQAMMAFLAANIKYPASALEKGIQGRVVLRFVVSTDGSITDVEVTKSVDPSCDAEAVRVAKSMPKWNPGMQNGKAVYVYYTLPVTFKL